LFVPDNQTASLIKSNNASYRPDRPTLLFFDSLGRYDSRTVDPIAAFLRQLVMLQQRAELNAAGITWDDKDCQS
ncbi:unnamed protein product, partial [Tilletia controversa]